MLDAGVEREARQRALIAAALAAYRRGASTLALLRQELAALALELELAPRDWLIDFQTEVNELEVLHAVAVDRRVVHDLPAEYRADADETVTRLESLLDRLPALPDDGADRLA